MADFPALPLWTDAYLADTHPLLTLEQQGCYMLLLMTQWRRHDDVLPDDDKWFCRLLGVHGNKWKTLRASVLEAFFTRDEEGNWYQKRLRKERDFVEKRRRKAKESVEKRWSKVRKNNELVDTVVIPRAPVLPTPTPIEESKTPPIVPPRGKRKKSGWPDEFDLTEPMADYARRITPKVDARAEFERFRCNAESKGLMYVDWVKAWYTWCRSPYGKTMINGQGPNQHQQKKRPQIADMLAAAEDAPTSSNPERSH